ncbi:PE-PPE domain-containing protein [[Mycobacterium] burgundiense]|uniref:PE-PPE domain-containing protein n=1 Tax=[Mycobacterium] burgundiense TaxID=3064286 RepID=A0ABM9M4T9_9MYCO|nr:PE-PPE domain-containing protein [Mycolicibacterium sp. MU0053]CAJ1510144.1 PE-PPE domain-containing protein [Mycolicibacterium sp. MU0053]
MPANKEGARARRRRLGRTAAAKVALSGVAVLSAVAVSVAPFTAEAATYIVGAPDWLGVNNFENDANALYNAIVDDRKKPAATLIGWGTGGVALNPQWVQWYNPNLGGLNLGDIDLGDLSAADITALLGQLDLNELTNSDRDQYYTPREWGQIGTEPVLVDNPEYQQAFEDALAAVMQEDREAILVADTINVTISYTVAQPSWWNSGYSIPVLGSVSLASLLGRWDQQKIAGQSVGAPITTTVSIDNPFQGDPAALDDFLETGVYQGAYPVQIDPAELGLKKPANPLPSWVPGRGAAWDGAWNWLTNQMGTIDVGDIDYNLNRTMFGLPGASWDDRAAALVDPSIPKQVSEDQPTYGWIPGGWTTTTFGQWVSPTDDIFGLQDLDLAALLNGDFDLSSLSALTGLTTRDLAYYLSGDMGFLAPLLNWTAYFHNTNLIGYGDGAIAAGLAYQKFIDAVTSGEIKAGAPQTDGRYIVITTDEDGNRVVREVNHTTGDGGWDEVISSYPLPGDLVFPDLPADGPAYSEIPGGVLDIHLFTLALLRNPGRANGGLYARFAPIYEELTGNNPVSPDSQNVLPAGLEGLDIAKLLLGEGGAPDITIDDLGNLVAMLEDADGKPMVITIKTDLTWQYDLLSDAPVTANPLAWANSAAAALLAVNVASALVTYDDGDLDFESYVADDGTIYGTVTLGQLPLLSPIRLLAGAIETATGEDINTPLVDALEPLLKTLTNVAYTDWVRVENPDGTVSYDRTLDQMHVPTLFGTPTMTTAERAQLAGDVIAILGAGLGAEITDINGRFLAGAEKLLGEIDVALPAELKEAWTKTVPRLGSVITEVSAKVGAGVGTVLGGAVDAVEPDALQQRSNGDRQTQLAAAQRDTDREVKPVKDLDGDVVDPATATDEVQGGPASGEDSDAEVALAEQQPATSESAGAVGKTRLQDSLTKTRADLKDARDEVRANVKQARDNAKANVKKAGDNIKKSVKDTAEKVRKAVAPKPKAEKKVRGGDE